MPSPRRSSWLTLGLLAAIGCDDRATMAAGSGTPAPAAVELDSETAESESKPAPTLTIAIYDTPLTDPPQAAQTQFSIARTRDLHICATWSALEGEHFEIRQFYAPSGELYYQKLIPFSTDIDQPYPFTHPVSIPHATLIQPALPNARGELVVCDQLAVAGAWIGDHQLTGAWRLDISLDGAKSAALSHSFDIAP